MAVLKLWVMSNLNQSHDSTRYYAFNYSQEIKLLFSDLEKKKKKKGVASTNSENKISDFTLFALFHARIIDSFVMRF